MQRERIAFPSWWWWWFTEVSSPPSIPMILLLDGSTCQHVLPLMLVFEGGVGHTGRDKTGLHRDRGGGGCVWRRLRKSYVISSEIPRSMPSKLGTRLADQMMRHDRPTNQLVLCVTPRTWKIAFFFEENKILTPCVYV